MIDKVYLQWNNYQKLDKEEQLVYQYCCQNNIPVDYYSYKLISRRQINVTKNTLVVGDIRCFYQALKQLNIPIPTIDDYPEVLQFALNRKIVKKLAKHITYFPVFIKPAKRLKLFTGFVANDKFDLNYYVHVPNNELCYVSDVIEFTSEYRVFINQQKIVGIKPAPQSEDHINLLNLSIIDKSVELLGNNKAGYAIDFGLTKDNQTTLIEVNDGFSIGSYGLDYINYFNILLSRWEQLVN